MSTPEQWLKTMPGASWRDLDQLKEWIEAIQGEAFNEGWKQGIRDALDMSSNGLVMEILLDSLNKKGLWEKPLAKSQEGE